MKIHTKNYFVTPAAPPPRPKTNFNPTFSFVPGESDWQGSGCVRFMLASNVNLLVRVLVADSPGRPFGYARLRLGRVGEGEFQVTGEIKVTEYVSIQDQLLGYITIKFKVRILQAGPIKPDCNTRVCMGYLDRADLPIRTNPGNIATNV